MLIGLIKKWNFYYFYPKKKEDMCFSAAASFTAGSIITATGIATEIKVQKPSQRLFAGIPLIFGIQQIAEGFVWISLQKPDHLLMQNISTYIFLFAADLIWPVMVAASCLLMEENLKKRKLMRILLIPGIALSLYYGCCLLLFKVKPEILNCHVNYAGDFPHFMVIPAFLTYLVVTITPLLISSVKGVFWLGIMLFLGVVISALFYIQNITSVWCFFGAVISVMIYWVLSIQKNTAKNR
jgi:hypothetical protein